MIIMQLKGPFVQCFTRGHSVNWSVVHNFFSSQPILFIFNTKLMHYKTNLTTKFFPPRLARSCLPYAFIAKVLYFKTKTINCDKVLVLTFLLKNLFCPFSIPIKPCTWEIFQPNFVFLANPVRSLSRFKQMEKQTDGRTYMRTDRRTDRHLAGQTNIARSTQSHTRIYTCSDLIRIFQNVTNTMRKPHKPPINF